MQIVLSDHNCEGQARAIFRDRCAQRLAEIVFDIDNYRGLYRVYIPG